MHVWILESSALILFAIPGRLEECRESIELNEHRGLIRVISSAFRMALKLFVAT